MTKWTALTLHKVESREREEEQQTTGGLRGLSAPKLPMPPGGCMHKLFVPTSAWALARLPFAQRTRPHCNRVVRSQKIKWHLVHSTGNFLKPSAVPELSKHLCRCTPVAGYASHMGAPHPHGGVRGVQRSKPMQKEAVILLHSKQNSGLLAPVYFQRINLTKGTARPTITVMQPRHPTL